MKTEPKVMSKSFWVMLGVVKPLPPTPPETRMVVPADRKH